MGLFRKRAEEPGELERLRAEITAMSSRLEATESAKAELGQQMKSLTQRIDATPPPEPVAPPPPGVDPGEIDMLRARVKRVNDRIQEVENAINSRLDESTADQRDLDDKVSELSQRIVETPAPAPFASTPPPPVAPPAGVDAAELDDLRAQTKQINERLDEFDATLARRLSEIDARITAVSTELANQISELGNELDTVSTGGSGDATEVVEELRDAQLRLAAEQARYQIAFRQDLADLADRLKRG